MSMQPTENDTKLITEKSTPAGKAQSLMIGYRSGPLPPPAELKQYDEICPGSAKTIIKTFQKQANHRMEMERLTVDAQVESQRVQDNSITAKSEYDKTALSLGCFIMVLLIGLGAVFAFRQEYIPMGCFLAAPLFKVIKDTFSPAPKR